MPEGARETAAELGQALGRVEGKLDAALDQFRQQQAAHAALEQRVRGLELARAKVAAAAAGLALVVPSLVEWLLGKVTGAR
jgi:hypothetical protein